MKAPLSPSTWTGVRLVSVRDSRKLLEVVKRGRSQEVSRGVRARDGGQVAIPLDPDGYAEQELPLRVGQPARSRSSPGRPCRSRVLARSPLSVSMPSGCQVRPPELRQTWVSDSVGSDQRRRLRVTGTANERIVGLVSAESAVQADVGRHQTEGGAGEAFADLALPQPFGEAFDQTAERQAGTAALQLKIVSNEHRVRVAACVGQLGAGPPLREVAEPTRADRPSREPASSCPGRSAGWPGCSCRLHDCGFRSPTSASPRRSVPVRSCGITSVLRVGDRDRHRESETGRKKAVETPVGVELEGARRPVGRVAVDLVELPVLANERRGNAPTSDATSRASIAIAVPACETGLVSRMSSTHSSASGTADVPRPPGRSRPRPPGPQQIGRIDPRIRQMHEVRSIAGDVGSHVQPPHSAAPRGRCPAAASESRARPAVAARPRDRWRTPAPRSCYARRSAVQIEVPVVAAQLDKRLQDRLPPSRARGLASTRAALDSSAHSVDPPESRR